MTFCANADNHSRIRAMKTAWWAQNPAPPASRRLVTHRAARVILGATGREGIMTPKEFSMGTKGKGMHMGPYITHAFKRWKGATIYDRSAFITAMRQREVDLGRQGYLDAEGTAMARRTAENLAKKPDDDVTLEFKAKGMLLTVTVTCKKGVSTEVSVLPNLLVHDDMTQAFFQLDAAVGKCLGTSNFASSAGGSPNV